jgi:hypothetical protein
VDEAAEHITTPDRLSAVVLVNSAGTAVSNVTVGSFRQSYCPRQILGRVIASSRCASYGVLPIGALLGGTLGTLFGIRTGVWIAAAAQAVCVVILLPGPIRKYRDLPSTGEVDRHGL